MVVLGRLGGSLEIAAARRDVAREVHQWTAVAAASSGTANCNDQPTHAGEDPEAAVIHQKRISEWAPMQTNRCRLRRGTETCGQHAKRAAKPLTRLLRGFSSRRKAVWG
jgi:hypothetical protein